MRERERERRRERRKGRKRAHAESAKSGDSVQTNVVIGTTRLPIGSVLNERSSACRLSPPLSLSLSLSNCLPLRACSAWGVALAKYLNEEHARVQWLSKLDNLLLDFE